MEKPARTPIQITVQKWLTRILIISAIVLVISVILGVLNLILADNSTMTSIAKWSVVFSAGALTDGVLVEKALKLYEAYQGQN